MSKAIQVDLMTPECRANPYPTYARLRAEAPVHRVTLPDGRGLWLITRYDDAVAVLKDLRFVKDWRQAMSPEQLAAWPAEISPLTRNLLNVDPPDHTRLRALVHKAFTAPFVERLRGRIQEITDQLIDAVKDRGQMDLIDEFAFQLPILVIAEMLGVPPRDRDRIRRWSSVLVASEVETPETLRERKPHIDAFSAYLRELCDERRRAPSDDLISALVNAEEAGQKLNQLELTAMVSLLLIAGHETTINLIGNGVLALLSHPEELARLKANPSLIKPAVEELLRFNSPVEMSTARFASEDISFGGALIPRGEQVLVVIASANHDRAQFKDPTALDLTREDNRHLAFGHGIHYCVGAPLARLEAQIGIGTLFRRLPDLRLAVAPEAIRWRSGVFLRGLRELPVTFSTDSTDTEALR